MCSIGTSVKGPWAEHPTFISNNLGGGGDHEYYRCGLPGRSQSLFEFLCSAKAKLRHERGMVEVVEAGDVGIFTLDRSWSGLVRALGMKSTALHTQTDFFSANYSICA